MPLTTAQEIVQNSGVGSSESVASVIFGFIIAAGGAAMWVRRKLSKDGLDIKKDGAEGDLIKHLEKERDVLKADKDQLLTRLLQVDNEKHEAVNKVGQLTVQVGHLTTQVSRLEELVATMGDKLDKMGGYQLENVKLTEKLSNMKQIFDLKCNNCTFKQQCVSDPQNSGLFNISTDGQ